MHMVVLWECPLDSEYNVKARFDARAMLRLHMAEVEGWLQVRGQRDGNSS